jgi:hypothetical protein
MTWTATEVKPLLQGPGTKQAIVLITADNSYAGGGGETVDLSVIFPNEVYGGTPIEDNAQGGYKMTYDLAASGAPATGKVIAYTGDYDPAADSPLVEADGATDLSAVCTGRWMFWGY